MPVPLPLGIRRRVVPYVISVGFADVVFLLVEGELDGNTVTGFLDSLTIRDIDVDPVLKVGCRVVEGREEAM